MKRTLFLLILCLYSSVSLSNDAYLKIIAEEYVTGFTAGVEKYNSSKPLGLPVIKRGKGQYYFNVRTHLVEFSIVEFIQNKIRVDKKMINFPLNPKREIKTVRLFDLLVPMALADDQGDADPTRIIIATLGSLEKNLQETSIYCSLKDMASPFGLSTCKRDNARANLDKIKNAIDRKKYNCDNITDAQARDTSSTLYTVTTDTEGDFRQVRELIVRISESREKNVRTFFKDYLASERNSYGSCFDVVTAGTIIDTKGGDLKVGARNANGMKLSPEREKMVTDAHDVCNKIEELRTCLVQVSSRYNSVVNSGRGTKTSNSLPLIENQLNTQNISK